MIKQKIVVQYDSEVELESIFRKANFEELPVSIIQDIGKTEFKELTWTACAIGPRSNKKIDKITRHLKLW